MIVGQHESETLWSSPSRFWLRAAGTRTAGIRTAGISTVSIDAADFENNDFPRRRSGVGVREAAQPVPT
jgi:hypothetical protein